MKWSNYNNVIVFIQESEQRPLKENVAECVHFARKWNTHYAWSKYIQWGREWEERRKDDASTAFHLLKGQEQRKMYPAAPLPCPNVIIITVWGRRKGKLPQEKFAFNSHHGICEEVEVWWKKTWVWVLLRDKSLSLQHHLHYSRIGFWSQSFKGVFNTDGNLFLGVLSKYIC